MFDCIIYSIDTVKRPATLDGMAPRRAPDPGERRRDPERARERLLDAAVEEFGAKGFAGARVKRIAERAGLNQQLVSYYFGGKAGLYEALQRRWRETSADLNRPELPLGEVVVNFLRESLANPAWSRLLVWENLAEAGPDDPAVDNTELMRWIVADIRRRQTAGELAADLDPAYAALALFAMGAAPIVLPRVAHRITGLDPTSPKFARAYAEQLRRLVRRLSGAADDS
jgi:TetR/AcrR family transcriptional regulator